MIAKKQFINGNFLKSSGNQGFQLFNGVMEVRNGVIKEFSNTTKTENAIDLKNAIIIPTFNNQHVHLGETVFRPLPKTMSLLEYIKYTEQKNIEFGKDKQTTWVNAALTTLQECLKTGTTEINTIRGNDVVPKFPIKAKCGYPIMRSKKLEQFFQQGLPGFDNFYKSSIDKNVEPGIFLHSFYTNDKDSVSLVQNILDKYNCFLAIHVAEDLESEQLIKEKWNGQNSMQLLKHFNLLSEKTILVHGAFINDEELDWVKDANANIVICPISSKNLLTQYANPIKLGNLGIDWSIASDGLATGLTADLIKQAQVIKKDLPEITDQKLLQAITTNHTLDVGKNATFLSYSTDKISNILNGNVKFDGMYVDGEEIPLL